MTDSAMSLGSNFVCNPHCVAFEWVLCRLRTNGAISGSLLVVFDQNYYVRGLK